MPHGKISYGHYRHHSMTKPDRKDERSEEWKVNNVKWVQAQMVNIVNRVHWVAGEDAHSGTGKINYAK